MRVSTAPHSGTSSTMHTMCRTSVFTASTVTSKHAARPPHSRRMVVARTAMMDPPSGRLLQQVHDLQQPASLPGEPQPQHGGTSSSSSHRGGLLHEPSDGPSTSYGGPRQLQGTPQSSRHGRGAGRPASSGDRPQQQQQQRQRQGTPGAQQPPQQQQGVPSKRGKRGRNRSWTRVVPPPGSPVASELLQRSGLSHLAHVPVGSLQRRRAPRPPTGKPRQDMPLLQYVQEQIATVMDEERQLLAEQQQELERMRQQLDVVLQQQMQWGFLQTPPGQQQQQQQAQSLVMAPTADWQDTPQPPQQQQQPPSPLLRAQQEQQDVPGLALLEELQQQQAQLEGRGLLPSPPAPEPRPLPAAAGGAQVEDEQSVAQAVHELEQQHQQQAAAQLPDPQQLQRQLQEMGQAVQEQLAELAVPVAYDPVADAVPATAVHTSIASITNRIIKVLSQPQPPPEQLAALDALGLYQVHSALKMAVRWGHAHVVPAIDRYLRSRQDANEHTLAVIFDAYTQANRLDLALELWSGLRAERLDIGPIAASTLLRCCARARDVDAGLRVFEQLMRGRVTFNRFAYNCIIHLCALAGRLEDAMGVYNLMRLETEEANLPDEFTYSGMVRAMLASGKLEGLQTLFENALEDNIQPDDKLYVHLITAAARAGDLPLARTIFQHRQRERAEAFADASSSRRSGGMQQATPLPEQDGSLFVVNALLAAYAQVGDMQAAMRVYQRQLLGQQLVPDVYTFSSLLTCMARSSGVTLDEVEAVRSWMQLYGVRLTAVTGTALVNAYRRVHTWGAPRPGTVVQQLSAKAQQQVRGKAQQRQQQQEQQQQQDGEQAVQDSTTAPAGGQSQEATEDDASAAGVEAQFEVQTASPAVAAAARELQHARLPPFAAALLEEGSVEGFALARALGVFQQLLGGRRANAQAFTVMMAFYLECGCVEGFRELWQEAQDCGVVLTAEAFDVLARSSMEAGLEGVTKDMQARLESAQAAGQHLGGAKSNKALAIKAMAGVKANLPGRRPGGSAPGVAAAGARQQWPLQRPEPTHHQQQPGPQPLVRQASTAPLVSTTADLVSSSSSNPAAAGGRLPRGGKVRVQRPMWPHQQQQGLQLEPQRPVQPQQQLDTPAAAAAQDQQPDPAVEAQAQSLQVDSPEPPPASTAAAAGESITAQQQQQQQQQQQWAQAQQQVPAGQGRQPHPAVEVEPQPLEAPVVDPQSAASTAAAGLALGVQQLLQQHQRPQQQVPVLEGHQEVQPSQHLQPLELSLSQGMDREQQPPQPQQQEQLGVPGEQQQLPLLQPLPAPVGWSASSATSRSLAPRVPAREQLLRPQRPAPVPRATSSQQDRPAAAKRVADVSKQQQQQRGDVGAGQTQHSVDAPAKGLHGHASKRHQQLWDL